jgi:type IV secretion system protein VirB9
MSARSIAFSILALGGCATAPLEIQSTLGTATTMEAEAPEPGDDLALRQTLPPEPARPPRTRVRQVSPAAALAAANASARRRPGPDGFVDATHIYDYAPGAIFELYATPEFLSTIELEEGETLLTTAAGDTARWMVEAVPAAGAEEGRTIVLVKPMRAGVRTNIVLVTDRRTYLVEAIAVAAGQAYSARIAWRYLEHGLARRVAGPTVTLDALNFRYRIETVRGRAPHWRPQRVFDDGRRTYIEFPLDLETSEAPPLFIRNGGEAQLVNYRVRGNRYVVDRLFDAAELRLGDRHPIVVRISREARR